MGGIGIDKLFGETEDGYAFKAFRYDYCAFNERDITYVCEYDYSDNKRLELMPKSSKVKTSQKTKHLTKQGKMHGQAYEAFKSLKSNLTQNKSK